MNKLILFLSIVLVLPPAYSQEGEWIDPNHAERVSRIKNSYKPHWFSRANHSFEERFEEWEIAGMSLVMAYEGKPVWTMTHGLADITTDTPVNESTLFQAASISKTFTAIRILQLEEEGKVNLDEDVNLYLDLWKLPDNEFSENEKVTLRHILSHRAGLTVHGFPGYKQNETLPSVPDILDGKGNTPAVRVDIPIGASYRYSGGGYMILQLVIESLDQMDFASSMDKHILEPLGMNHSTFGLLDPNTTQRDISSAYFARQEDIEGRWHNYPEQAAGGLWTTPQDLLKFALELQCIYQSGTDGILRHTTLMEMLVPLSDEPPYGLGIESWSHTFLHSGVNAGFNGIFIAGKDKPIAYVMMSNSMNGRVWRETMDAINREYNVTD